LDSINLNKKIGDKLSVANAKANLSLAYSKRGGPGDLETALDTIKEALAFDLQEKNTRGLIRDYRIMFEFYNKMNDTKNASICEEKLKEALNAIEETTRMPYVDRSYQDYLD